MEILTKNRSKMTMMNFFIVLLVLMVEKLLAKGKSQQSFDWWMHWPIDWLTHFLDDILSNRIKIIIPKTAVVTLDDFTQILIFGFSLALTYPWVSYIDSRELPLKFVIIKCVIIQISAQGVFKII